MTTRARASAPGPAAHRRNDPSPAKEAARQHNKSGRAKTHLELVVATVRAHPGKTAPELARLCGLDHVETQRRLSDAAGKRGGCVLSKGEPRRCDVKRKRLTTWILRIPKPKAERQGELF